MVRYGVVWQGRVPLAVDYVVQAGVQCTMHTSTSKDKISIRQELLRVVACGAASLQKPGESGGRKGNPG